MKYDGQIEIATGLSRLTLKWTNVKLEWSEFVAKLKEEHRTNETLREFLAAPKEQQSQIKDVGGYVGGYLKAGRRRPDHVLRRQLITLDVDFAYPDFWQDFCLMYNNAAVLHGTHKNSPTSPRYRLVCPINRPVTVEEYLAISRRIAGSLGIDLFDNSTFEPSRLMFWPSNPSDVDYYFEFQDGPWFDADAILASYEDWTDVSSWPCSDSQIDAKNEKAKKQEDPELKRGIIGAFCKAYTISEAIETFLPDVYTKTAVKDRYTYTKGSTAAGMVVYDDKFSFSHHGTDPAGGRLCNAFDLVRIHKFGDLDKDRDGESRPSLLAMEDLARADAKVKILIAKNNLADAKYDFADVPEDNPVDFSDTEWMTELEVERSGGYKASAANLNLIFGHDPRLKRLFKLNDFDNKVYVFGTLPWRRVSKPEPIRNVDYAGVRNYIEIIYGITSSAKIDDALALECERNHFHPVREYLQDLEWDGQKRVDTLLYKLFGVPLNTYTKEALRKTLVGAVARVFKPGCKFDLVLTLISTMQGTGKSSFFRALGRKWFSDTFLTVQGKDAYEQLQGTWVMEMAELAGLKKADVESVKHFISKQSDTFRPAYARVPETFERQCVFVATTNEVAFLRDSTGNRRFMPIDVEEVKLVDNKELMSFLNNDAYIDQIWAEAMELYRSGENLFLSKEAEAIAQGNQELHEEVDPRIGLIEDYLERLLPEDWDKKDVFERQNWLEDPLAAGTVQREIVCAMEVWVEALGKSRDDFDRYNSRDLNNVLRSIDGWELTDKFTRFNLYGKQRTYRRCRKG